MGKWTREKVDSGKLNNGNEYEAKDRLSREQLNAMVNSGLYAQDFAEHLTDTPDTSAANNSGSASVQIVDNVVNGKTFKKFKFSNIKGEQGWGIARANKTFENSYPLSTLLNWVGKTNDYFTGVTNFDGRVGDIVFLPFKISDEGNSVGYMVCKVRGYESTNSKIYVDNLLFNYSPRGDKGDKGDTFTGGDVGSIKFAKAGSGFTFVTKDGVEFFVYGDGVNYSRLYTQVKGKDGAYQYYPLMDENGKLYSGKNEVLTTAGGEITGTLDFNGNVNFIDLGTTSYMRGRTSSGTKFDLIGLVNSTRFQVGGSYPSLELKGKDARPKYIASADTANPKEIAFLSDIPTITFDESTGVLTITTG